MLKTLQLFNGILSEGNGVTTSLNDKEIGSLILIVEVQRPKIYPKITKLLSFSSLSNDDNEHLRRITITAGFLELRVGSRLNNGN